MVLYLDFLLHKYPLGGEIGGGAMVCERRVSGSCKAPMDSGGRIWQIGNRSATPTKVGVL